MNNISFDSQIYQRPAQFVLGFHGCDKKVAEKVLLSNDGHLTSSENGYDWLGNGIYFWLNDPQRALEWAEQEKKRKPNKITTPFVIGAIIDLGLCLNFCERQAVDLVKKSYEELKNALKADGKEINSIYSNTMPDAGGFNLVRKLDYAVILNLHRMMKEKGQMFDTVYGYFQEGQDAFEGAGIKEKSHIQICVHNPNFIKGYFLPRKIPNNI